MDFDDYVVARRRRLVEHAVGLGLDDGAAEGLVDRVLQEQRARIGRARDPDPTTYAALERTVRGPSPHRRTAALGAGAVALAVVAGLLVWRSTRPAEQVAVPSAFARDVTDAAAALQRRGLQVGVTTTLGCEPQGLVVGSDPPAGAMADIGSTVVLKATIQTTAECVDADDRAAAWAFLGFVRGGPPPVFDDTVFVIYDGRDPAELPAAAAADPARWSSIQDIADAAAAPARTTTGLPRLVVTAGVPPPEQCGIARPATAADRPTLRLQVEPVEDEECPFTVDLYRSAAGVIDAVVIYSDRR